MKTQVATHTENQPFYITTVPMKITFSDYFLNLYTVYQSMQIVGF